MTAKHTQGEWRVAEAFTSKTPIVVGPDGKSIFSTRRLSEELIANCRIAAASPKMLAALLAAKAHIRDEIGQFGARSDYKDTDTIAVLDAAIAEATGEA